MSPAHDPDSVALDALRASLKSQYLAAFAMLRDIVERYPADAWVGGGHRNDAWQVAYHALYFTHLYLQPDVAAFRPWEGHRGDVQHPDGLSGAADPASPLPVLPEPYPKDAVLAYARYCEGLVDEAVDGFDLLAPTSGFPWYRMSKLEHQLNNLRHLQHHTGQLADRLRAATSAGTHWL